VRSRSFATLSLLAAAALVLTACGAGGGESEASPTGTPGDLCAAAAPTGTVSDAVVVEGDFGVAPTLAFNAPAEVTTPERTVVIEGDGDEVAAGDYISYALTAYDATTGEQLGALGYNPGEVTPVQISPDSALGAFFGCATVGTRVAVALPPSQQSPNPVIYALDLLGTTPADEWCAPQDFDGDAPTVTFGENGAPTIAIPAVEAPSAVSIEVLEEGDGETVEPGDAVEVNYTGVKWSDGTTFDSSWDRGESATFTTDGVVTGFQKALEEQKVGSTVLVAMPPECGYGSSTGHELQNETLVFVVNIIATEHAG
jgi:hypothetical protein